MSLLSSSTIPKAQNAMYCWWERAWLLHMSRFCYNTNDFKRSDDDFNKAKSQSFGYTQDVMTYSQSRNPIVAIPGTSERFALYLCFTMNYASKAKLVTIKQK